MKKTNDWYRLHGKCLAAVAIITMVVLTLNVVPGQAFTVFENGQVTAVLDSTVTYGLMSRVSGRDSDQISIANGGKAVTPNHDDGNLNYDTGIVSNQLRIVSELDVAADNFGLFLRGTAFYDYETMQGSRERTELGGNAENQQGQDAEILDAYIWGNTEIGSVPLQIRVGDQVINWGESTFILGGVGLNTINPVNVSKLRSPGASLKEAVVPEGMVFVSVGLTENLSVEGVYVYDWEETQFDESGTYYSGLDFAGEDGYKVILAAGAPDNGLASVADTMFSVPRAKDDTPDSQGQFGILFRYFVPQLNDTEFSLSYMRYHSKTPTWNLKTGSQSAIGDFVGTVTADPSALFPALSTYLGQTSYRMAFGEDIDTFSLGFNTEVGGFALQGEVTYRKDVPLQIDDLEIIFALAGSVMPGVDVANQVGSYLGQADTWIDGFIFRDTIQTQFTVTKLLGAILGAEGSVVLGEFAWQHIYDMPDKDKLRLETYGPWGSGNKILNPGFNLPYEGDGDYPDADSFGYVLFGRLDYNNVIGPIGFSPHLAWSHDFAGISPNGGPFIEGRKAITFGVEARYLNNLTADLSYTNYFGAGKLNQINDRDYVALNVQYSF